MSQDNYQPPQADITPSLSEDSVEEDLAGFIGPKNTDYYLERYRRIQGGSSIGWHWPAFFLTSGWLLYRKMWLFALLYIVGMPIMVSMVMVLLGALFGETAGSTFYYAYVLSLFVVVPLFANKLYLSRALKYIERINASGFAEDRRRRFIEKSGGTSLVAALVLLIVPLSGILAAIAIPAYQDYTIRAQVAEGVSLGSAARVAVTEYYELERSLPYDNAEADLADPEDISGTYVDSVSVESGTIIVTFGRSANTTISGMSIYLVPEPLAGGGLEWACERGEIDRKWVPASCRSL